MLAVVLWHGGFFHRAELLVALIALVTAVIARPRLRWWDPVLWALIAMAIANLVATAVAFRLDAVSPALAACALVPAYAVFCDLEPSDRSAFLLVVAAVAGACATASIAGVLLRLTPLAERIDGIWRAAGPLEYPPALALLVVCGLAAVYALAASRGDARSSTLFLAGVLWCALLLTADRAGVVMGLAVSVLFAVRIPPIRRMWPAAVAALVLTAGLVALDEPGTTRLTAHLTGSAIADRTPIWSDAWSAFGRHPLVGFGPGGYARISLGKVDTGAVGLAHDLPLEQAVEAGALAGIAAFLLVCASGLRCGLALLRSDPEVLAYACIGLTVVLSGVYDFTWSFAPLAVLGVAGVAASLPATAARTGADSNATTAARRQRLRSP